MRILIIEDDADIAGNIGDFLLACDHDVDFAANGEHGLQLATGEPFDAIVLDINLPRMNGFEVCRRLRTDHALQTPVLMLTARGSLADKMTGFDAGAWDYLVKPFALEELLLRLNALQLRQQPDRSRVITWGELTLDLARHQLTRAGQPIRLHTASLRIIESLIRAAPNIVSRRELEYLLWGDHPPPSNPLRSHLHEIRKAMDKPFRFPMLRTVHGVGYCLRDNEGENEDAN
ncbi:MAG: response regulator transcription factor [Wenzhouxiangellaceae bacterium]